MTHTRPDIRRRIRDGAERAGRRLAFVRPQLPHSRRQRTTIVALHDVHIHVRRHIRAAYLQSICSTHTIYYYDMRQKVRSHEVDGWVPFCAPRK